MKEYSRFRLGVEISLVSLMLSGLVFGCSSPQSIGIRVGELQKPHPVVHKQSGPPTHAPAHGYRKKFGYQYYPTANVYYDQSRGVYFYLSGSEWEMALSLPSSIRIDLHESVSLELETDRPYLENAKHIKQVKYKGKGAKQKAPKWKR